jgi:undecaprenyl-diphosphatase
MEYLLLLKAVVLGIVEGLTEFLPVSSTGHLIISGDLLDFTGERAATFEVFIQLGAILAVVWMYRVKVMSVLTGLDQPQAQRFVLNLIVAFIPAAIMGFLLHGYIKAYLFNPVTVSWALVVGGFAMLIIERYAPSPRVTDVDDMRTSDALKVGLAQVLALFPGVSRAGATIMGGLATGLSRTAATEFSFFLAIPTMFAATLYDLYKSAEFLHVSDAPVFAVGFVTSFISALIVIHLFLHYVAHHKFAVFAWYRIGFGVLALWYFL